MPCGRRSWADADTAGAAAIDPDVAEMAASASRVDVVRPMYAEPQAYGAVELAVDDLSTDPRLRDAGVAFTPTVTSDSSEERPDAPSVTGGEPSARSASSGEGATLQDATGEATTLPATSAAHKVSVTGRKVLDDVTWLIGPGDRFGIVGANGAGKSTLLKILDGSITPTAGHVNIGKTVRFAVLSQRLDELEALGKYKVKEVLSRYKPSYIVDGKEVTPGQLMERLGFEAAQLMTPIRDLSGGQKRRMQLLLILLDEPNVLIMDEPGNDLDTDMLAVMEDLLDTWPGTLIVVSHDRYLLERVTDQQFALIGGKVRHLPGGVDDYLRMVDDIKAGRDPFGGASAEARPKRARPAGRPRAPTAPAFPVFPLPAPPCPVPDSVPPAPMRREPRRALRQPDPVPSVPEPAASPSERRPLRQPPGPDNSRRRSSPARRSTRRRSASLRSSGSWPSWRRRNPSLRPGWLNTTRATTPASTR